MRSIKKLLACLAFALVAGFAFAQPGPNDPAQGPTPVHQQRPGSYLQALGLTEAQIAQVKVVFEKERTEDQTTNAEIRVLRAQIDLAMTSATPDLKAVNALVDKKVALVADREKAQLAAEAQIHALVGDGPFYQLKRWWLAQGPQMNSRGGPVR